jgi:hypothetical protein
VHNQIKLYCVVLFIAFAKAASAQDPGGHERVLIPIYHDLIVNGAYGSQWATELTIRNEADVPVEIFQQECEYRCSCNPVPGCRQGEPVQPHTAGPTTGHVTAYKGIFLYVERNAAADVAFQLRVRDISRNAYSWGTEIPVVRENDMLLTTARMLDIPTDERFRLHLRIYAVRDRFTPGEARLRIFPAEGNEPLAERVITLPVVGLVSGDDPAYPSYAEIPNLAAVIPAGEARPIRVEVEPLTPNMPIWTFTTITNNETQQVTTVTPQ